MSQNARPFNINELVVHLGIVLILAWAVGVVLNVWIPQAWGLSVLAPVSYFRCILIVLIARGIHPLHG